MATKSPQLKEKIDDLFTRISSLERDVLALKKYFKFIKRGTDKEIWEKIKPSYRKAQEKVFKEKYPDLYARIKKTK